MRFSHSLRSLGLVAVLGLCVLGGQLMTPVHARSVTSGWQPAVSGSGGFAGAVNAISIDPRNAQIIVIGTDTGGLWRTTDGGTTWQSVTTSAGPWQINSIARHPITKDTLYAGGPTGLLRSTDNGITWLSVTPTSTVSNCVTNPTPRFYIDTVAISPDGLTLLTAIGDSTSDSPGIRRSVDGGLTWTQTLCTSQDANDVAFSSSGRAIALQDLTDTANNRGLVTSTNGAAPWARPNGFKDIFRRVVFAPGDPNVVYALGFQLYRSQDAGVTLSATSTKAFSVEQSSSQYALWVDPTNSNVIVTGDTDFYRSTDGGGTFAQISDWTTSPQTPGVNARTAVSDPGFNGTTNTRVFVGTSTGIFRVDDIYAATPVWTPLNNGLAAASFMSVAAAPNGSLLAVTPGSLALTQPANLGAVTRVARQAVVRVPASGTGSTTTWLAANQTGSDIQIILVAPHPRTISVDSVDGSVVFVANGPTYSVFRSLDGGASFAKLTVPASFTNQHGTFTFNFGLPDPTDRTRMVLFYMSPGITGQGLYRSLDATSATPTWTKLAAPVDTFGRYFDAAFDPADSSQLWVGGSNANGLTFRSSSDFTAASPTFADFAAFPTSFVGLQVNRVTRSASNGRVGCVQGTIGDATVASSPRQFFCTSDAGVTWTRRADPGVLATDITTDPFNPSIMFVASATGVYQTTDGGVTWAQNSPLASFPVSSFAWRGHTLVAATLGRGLWTLDTNTLMTASPSTLRFEASKAGAGGPFTAVTSPQTVTVSFAGTSSGWTAAANQPWVKLSPASGSGNGPFTASIADPTNAINASTSLTAVITVTPTDTTIAAAQVTVSLVVDQTGASTAPAFGSFDTPADGAVSLSGAIAVTGWALDDIGVNRVELYRNCVEAIDRSRGACGAPASGLAPNYVYLGVGNFVTGARPDVEAAYGTQPQASRAGWGYLLLTNELPHQTSGAVVGGQGTYVLTAVAVDQEGHKTVLGTKTITLDNDHATAPFGAIDTPDPGGTIPGTVAPFNDPNTYPNFGWAVTQAGKCIDVTSTASYGVQIDGVSRPLTLNTNWVAGLSRSDIASSFSGLCNTANAGAVYYIHPSALGLAAGLHTLAWTVTDSAGKTAGIGSRFFSLVNSAGADVPSPVVASSAAMLAIATRSLSAAIGPDDHQPFTTIVDGAVRVPSTSRVVIDLGGPVQAGAQVVNGATRALPPGSTLDAANGRFYWQPIVGFLGAFDFVFTTADGRVPVTITLVDPSLFAGRGLEMVIDLPVANSAIDGSLRVAGWALDPRSLSGSGIDTIHVWAYRRDVDDVAPQFLGVAALGGLRPDVEQIYGPQFDATGFELSTGALASGTYDLVVYGWSARTGGWEDARVVRVVVK